jgi:superfamily II DNA or RNA helicase
MRVSGGSLRGEGFPGLRFSGTLRPSQAEVVRIAEAQLQGGQRRLHVVAPPGSGKTVIGLYLWSQVIRCPALVLSPNSAIQGQWAARTSMLSGPQGASLEDAISTTTDSAGLLASLTYQSITLPARASEAMQDRAVDL